MNFSHRSTSMFFGIATALGTLLAAAPASAQFRCPPGFSRNRFGRCTPARQVMCPPGSMLRGGLCVVVNTPPPRACQLGWAVFNGACVPVNQPATACPSGLALINGTCVVPRQPPTACPSGLWLISGRCMLIHETGTPTACPDGQYPHEGTCIGTRTAVAVPPMQVVPPVQVGRPVQMAQPVPMQQPQVACPPHQVLSGGVCVRVAFQASAQVCPAGWTFFRGMCRPG